MGKNLKRQNDGGLGKPGGVARPGGKLSVSSRSKRHKQMSLTPFLRTPALAEETPVLQAKPMRMDISSTGLHKLGQLNIRTLQKQQPSALTAATTQGRPEVQAKPHRQGPASPNDDDDAFIISMSQTYERTQPDPCLGYGPVAQDDVELSLRRTLHYQTTGSTHYYNQHKQDLYLVNTAAIVEDSATVVVTSTSTPAHEASFASDMGPDDPSATEPTCEGRGSNQRINKDEGPAGTAPDSSTAVAQLVVCASIEFYPHCTHAVLSISAGPAATPELQGGGSVVCAATTTTCDVADDGTTPPQVGLPLFPIFTQGRAACRHRPIHLVRHGESEYNLACKRRGGFGDPNDIFDARLTLTGKKQARGLRPQLLDLMQQHGDPLFIVSPLSRAIETFLHMLPDPERLRQEGMLVAGGGCKGELLSKPLNVVICPFLTEFLLTSGDVGRPRSVLIESYPQVAEQLHRGLDRERWWYENASRGPNCAMSKALNSTEPDRLSKARVDRFRQFVFSQTHRPIVVVGHANFFRTLTHDSGYMGNCQMVAWAP